MPIRVGSSGVGSVFVGSQPVSSVYAGSRLVWESVSWDFVDDFERSSIGSAWQGSGGLIAGTAPNRHLKKNTSAGSSTYWTVQQFGGDDFVAEALLGPVQDQQQVGSILWGTPNEYLYVEFSRAGNNMIGDYDGSTWVRRATLPNREWSEGDVIRVERTGTTVTVSRNGSPLVSGNSTIARGPGNRRLGLSVRMDLNFFIRWYGPTFDDVRVRAI